MKLVALIFLSFVSMSLGGVDSASLLKISPGMDLENVKQLELSDWVGTIGIFGDDSQTTLSNFTPKPDKPFYAVLTPPTDFRLLGAPVKRTGIYFLPEDGSFKVFGVTVHFDLEENHHQDLRNLLNKQFGADINGHWATGSTVLLCFPPELALVDLDKQEAAARLLNLISD